MTRHGAGPFVTFDEQFRRRLPEPHNTNAGWQGTFRRGELDLPLLRYALARCDGVQPLPLHTWIPLVHTAATLCHAYRVEGQLCDCLPGASMRVEAQSIERLYREWPTDNEKAAVDLIANQLGLQLCIGRTGRHGWRKRDEHYKAACTARTPHAPSRESNRAARAGAVAKKAFRRTS